MTMQANQPILCLGEIAKWKIDITEGIQAMYNLICNDTNEPLTDENGVAVVYATGNECALAMHEMQATTGKRYRPARVIDPNWRTRELAKALTEYVLPKWQVLFFHQLETRDRFTGNQSVRWCSTDYAFSIDRAEFYTGEPIRQRNIVLPVISDHYMHVSKLDASKIAYTKDEESGSADKQTQTTVGRYLTAFYPDLDNELIKYINSLHQQEYQPVAVKFATGEKITEIYKACHDSGASSCMTKPDHFYKSSCHPTLVFSAGDLALAYIADFEDSHIKARALVWPDKKIYARLYGDYETLRSGLQTLGYTSDGTFQGAKIKRIEDANSDRLVLPYLDGVQGISIIDDQWLEIDSYGDIQACNVYGLQSPDNYTTCDNCEDDIATEDDAYTVYTRRNSTATYCEHCRDYQAFWCEGTQEYIRNDREMTVDGQSYSYWYVEDNASRCEYSDDYTFGDMVTVYTGPKDADAESWSESVADDESFICRITGNRYANNLQVIDDWSDEPRAEFNQPDDQPEPEMIICARSYQSGFACAA